MLDVVMFVNVSLWFKELYEHVMELTMLLVIPVQVGVLVWIICTALGEFGFHRGKST